MSKRIDDKQKHTTHFEKERFFSMNAAAVDFVETLMVKEIPVYVPLLLYISAGRRQILEKGIVPMPESILPAMEPRWHATKEQ